MLPTSSGLIDRNSCDFHFHLSAHPSPLFAFAFPLPFALALVVVEMFCVFSSPSCAHSVTRSLAHYYYCQRVHEIWFHCKNILISHANREPHSICLAINMDIFSFGEYTMLLLTAPYSVWSLRYVMLAKTDWILSNKLYMCNPKIVTFQNKWRVVAQWLRERIDWVREKEKEMIK